MPTLTSPGGGVIYSAKDKAEAINAHFASQQSNVPDRPVSMSSTPVPPRSPSDETIPSVGESQGPRRVSRGRSNRRFIIHPDMVLTQLKKQKCRTAPGCDGITGRMLTETASAVCSSLTVLFNRAIAEGEYPSIWKRADVTPVPKSQSPSEPKNFRPISLLSLVSKIFERIIVSWLTSDLSTHDLQFAFKAGSGTVNALVAVTQMVHDCLNSYPASKVVGVFFDVRAAFDSVPHRALISKLEARGLDPTISILLRSYLTGRTQRVRVDGALSDYMPVCSGVPQGSIIGPKLFTEYIADLHALNDGQMWPGGSRSLLPVY
ncbi:MAG: hypothetical protein GY696_30390, partial [Gammaproteobacteria bacterium]|nr:hypothetical protein [Gammaproteobacteria bacterium]